MCDMYSIEFTLFFFFYNMLVYFGIFCAYRIGLRDGRLDSEK